MSPGWAGGLLALALAAPGEASAAGRIAIDHAPLECVPYDRYTRIAATGATADRVAAAQLQFRARSDGGWYSVGMAAQGTEWSAFLPRPARPLASFEYRIVMRAPDAGETATPAVAVPVRDEAECGSPARSSAEVAVPIVVRVPEGAPSVPPVPAGFSPAGVVAPEEHARASGLKTLAFGAGLAGGITAVVLGGGAATQRPEVDVVVPGFAFSGTVPLPGSVLSLNSRLSVFLLLTGRMTNPFQFTWDFTMMGVGGDRACAFMNGRNSVSTSLPATVTLGGFLRRSEDCGERFDVDRARLRVFLGPRILFEEIQALAFHFEP